MWVCYAQVAVSYSELQWVAVSCSGLQWVAVSCSELQWVAVSCSELRVTNDEWHCKLLRCGPCVCVRMCAMMNDTVYLWDVGHMCVNVCVFTSSQLSVRNDELHCVWMIDDTMYHWKIGHTCVYVCVFNSLQLAVTRCNSLQLAATRCNSLQLTATHCISLQPTATHCNWATFNSSCKLSVGLCLFLVLSLLFPPQKKHWCHSEIWGACIYTCVCTFMYRCQ